MTELERKIIEIHCDESSHELLTSEASQPDRRFLGIGAIQIALENKEQYKIELKHIKNEYFIPWEMKWSKVSPSNLNFYKKVIDWFIDSKIKFRMVRIDTKGLDLDFWHNQDAELGFYKFYYQCLKHILCENFDYRIFTDFKTNRDKCRLKRLKFFLDFYSSGIVIDVQALASKDSLFIQLADLFTGAVIASNNDRVKSPAKQEFCAYLARKLHKQSLLYCSTKFGDPRFNIFCLEFGRIS
ncbi:DUF3800 domain-containing protein [candidate division KSB1 bacterium]|nr:DUF3800 domain-containing protein [candidate division KSB1 bacterium]